MTSGKSSPLAGFHLSQALLSLGFPVCFSRDERMLVLKDPPEQARDRDAQANGAKLATCQVFSGHMADEILSAHSATYVLCCPNFGTVELKSPIISPLHLGQWWIRLT